MCLLHAFACRYTPDANGFFAGQTGYGYISIAAFIEAAAALNCGSRSVSYYEQEGVLALASKTLAVTAILQAGRLSLDNAGAAVDILYDDDGQPREVRLAGGSSSNGADAAMS
jgi:D-galacturonate reductase